MALRLNGTDITTNRLNATNITLESLNGEQVYPTGPQTTANPTFSSQTIVEGFFEVIQVRVRNNDNAAAVIRFDFSNPPATSRGTINSNAYTGWVTVGQKGVGSYTLYATAQATGKGISGVVSYTVS